MRPTLIGARQADDGMVVRRADTLCDLPRPTGRFESKLLLWSEVVPGRLFSLAVSGDDVFVGLGGSSPADSSGVFRFDAANQSTWNDTSSLFVVASPSGEFVTSVDSSVSHHGANGSNTWSYTQPHDPTEQYTFLAGALALGPGDEVYALGTWGPPRLMKLVNGQPVWMKDIELTESAMRPLSRSADGSFYVLGTRGWSAAPHLVKLDPDGNVLTTVHRRSSIGHEALFGRSDLVRRRDREPREHRADWIVEGHYARQRPQRADALRGGAAEHEEVGFLPRPQGTQTSLFEQLPSARARRGAGR